MISHSLNSSGSALMTTFCSTLTVLLLLSPPSQLNAEPVAAVMQQIDTSRLHIDGVLGKAIDAGVQGRLKHLCKDANSRPIRLFDRAVADKETDKNWQGEHAGKWLVAASRAAGRTGDPQLIKYLRDVADFLVSQQRPNGYLGTYAPSIRITAKSDVNIKSWDVWVNAYMMLGLVELNKHLPNEKYIDAAKKIGDLYIETFQKGGKSIAHAGYHHGMVGTGSIDAAMELYFATGDEKYLEFAKYCTRQMEYRKGLELISRSLKGCDVALIGNGKNYEMTRNFVGLAKLYRATGNHDYLQAVLNSWQNIKDHHLTLTGGPWGGIGGHLECFNVEFFFNPYGFNETCTTMVWTRLNSQLLMLTGRAEYAQQLEKTAYNAILGAQFPDGFGWCYYSHTNGKRIRTSPWACCSSSGAMELEELPPVIYTIKDNGIALNIYTRSAAQIQLPGAGAVTIEQKTDYPFDGNIEVTITPQKNADFPVFVRIPRWADKAGVSVNGRVVPEKPVPGKYLDISRNWSPGDTLKISFPMKLRLAEISNEYNEKGEYIDTTQRFVAILRGPLVYATNLPDTLEHPTGFRVPTSDLLPFISPAETPPGLQGPAYKLRLPGKDPLTLVPFYEVGARKEGIHRTTWLRVE